MVIVVLFGLCSVVWGCVDIIALHQLKDGSDFREGVGQFACVEAVHVNVEGEGRSRAKN